MEYLVLPRVIALFVMMPLLCLYADVMGLLGGLVVGAGMLDLTVLQYVEATKKALTLDAIALGVVKAAVFGVLIGVAGCLRGMQAGSSASAVGEAATRAVVTGIVLIIVTDGLFAVVCNILGI
jgi:phospholipid/cholesterol/gamma-HCH transport system permease protein